MNPTDTTNIPGLEDPRQRTQNDASPNPITTGNELISYNQQQQQPIEQQSPIDFTDFLNLDDSQLASGSFETKK